MERPLRAEHGRGGRAGGKLERVPVALEQLPVLSPQLQAQMEGGCTLGEGLFATVA